MRATALIPVVSETEPGTGSPALRRDFSQPVSMTASVPTSQETGQSHFFVSLLLQWLEWLDIETYTA